MDDSNHRGSRPVTVPPSADAPAPRRWLALGALMTVAGIVMAAVAPVVGTAPAARVDAQQSAGGAVLLLGWIFLAWGVHRLGRAPDAG